ncbi:MAG TPA: TonB-dependent receptor [Gammaproteobacteria bacterium]|nr:TonB-dependent receptor [Gammaproteobacteria bacterium]
MMHHSRLRRAARSLRSGLTTNRTPIALAALATLRAAGAATATLLAAQVGAQTAAETASVRDTIVVTATRSEQSSFDLPLSIDAFGRDTIQDSQPQVNLSEVLNRAPGVVANTRQNYAQDLQISIRGFGARSTFGIRGVRLYSDGIPLTMPDGQGQAANVDLSSAERIEVMRGPFSALYGNSSGGVVSVFTEDGPKDFGATASLWSGTYDSQRLGVKLGGEAGKTNYVLDMARFETDGYRDHSTTTRDTFNGKAKWDLGDRSQLSVIANYLNQPGTEDPLGLTAAQVAANPRQAGTGAIAQNTRKDIDNAQVGVVFDHSLSDEGSLRMLGYYGERDVRQYLALTLPGRGVVDLVRDFNGADFRWTRHLATSGRPFTVTAGLSYDVMNETRKGFTNNAGTLGALGRNEDNQVSDLDPYAQIQWDLAHRWSLNAGVRRTEVEFTTNDHFIVAGNGDDSGSQTYSKTTPVVGVLLKVSPNLNVYANAGRGFETPTFAELAYRSVSGATTGFNFALQPAESDNTELGVKAVLGEKTRLDAAVFRTHTDNEIVVLVNQGGRSVFQNVDRTLREGLEISLDSSFGSGFTGTLAYTALTAEFSNTFLTCGTATVCPAPNLTVPAGNKIPGVPANSAYGELAWSNGKPSGFSTALEARWSGKVFTTDLNDEFAKSYTLVNWRAGLEQRRSGWSFKEFIRVENLFDEEYSGSVIVNATNAQYYEPAPGRWLVLGFSALR